jgi:hypothetical protein
MDSRTFVKKRKTYRRFLGAIFLEGSAGRKLLSGKGLRMKKPCEIEKARKKVSFYGREHPVFLPNRAVSGSFLTVKLLSALQVALQVELAMIVKTAIFEKVGQNP